MATLVRCPQGHQWQLTQAGLQSSVARALHCPFCGLAGGTPANRADQTFSPETATLPPEVATDPETASFLLPSVLLSDPIPLASPVRPEETGWPVQKCFAAEEGTV